MTVHREQGAKSRGQGLAEFALILPLMLFTIFVMIELARLLHAWISVENGARFGVRYAVTGEYDFAFCTSLYGGPCDTQAKQDGARLPSIRDATNSGSVGLLKNPLATVGTPGFFKITICSNKPGLVYFPSDSNSSTPADCQPQEDGGGPGDRVIVTVDFDHPLIAPILSSTWPKIHLTAKREGIVEQFRVARVVGLPATISIPTFTATVTSTATITTTPTPSLTPTPTPDCSLISVESSVLNGDYFDVVVHNGNVANVSLTGAWLDWFRYYSGQNFYGAEFAGSLYRNGPASPTSPSLADPIVPIPMVAGGTETWRASFTGVGGGGLVGQFTAVLTFDGVCTVSAVSELPTPTVTTTVTPTTTATQTLTPTTTLTPTRTPTRTITPTPSCTNITVTGSLFYSYYGMQVNVRNTNPTAIYLTQADFTWTDTYHPNQYVNYFQFNGSNYYPGNDYDPPTNVSSNRALASGATAAWYAIFGNVPSTGLGGTYSVTLTFDGRCTVSATLTRTATTPTPTRTPTITRTATASATIPFTPTITRTPTISPTATVTYTRTLTPTVTLTPTITLTRTITPTPTITRTSTRTPTVTLTPTVTRTGTPITPTVTLTPTITLTPLATKTPTITPTATNTLCFDC